MGNDGMCERGRAHCCCWPLPFPVKWNRYCRRNHQLVISRWKAGTSSHRRRPSDNHDRGGGGGGTRAQRQGPVDVMNGVAVDDGEGSKRGRYSYPFYEDVSAETFQKMKSLAAHPKVQSCWSTRGQLRVRLHDSETIIKVKSIFDSDEKIVG